jgi:hypothetical protein
MSFKRSFVVKMKIIPEHTVYRCEDCEYFVSRGRSFWEYDACYHDDYIAHSSDLDRKGLDIPDNCPRI